MNKKVKYLFSILAPVSLGELIDKITILEIKKIYMSGIKLKNVNKEMRTPTSQNTWVQSKKSNYSSQYSRDSGFLIYCLNQNRVQSAIERNRRRIQFRPSLHLWTSISEKRFFAP